MTLPANQWKDPAKWYEEREAATCKGCAHLTTLFNRPMCAKAVKRFPKKCKMYKESPT